MMFRYRYGLNFVGLDFVGCAFVVALAVLWGSGCPYKDNSDTTTKSSGGPGVVLDKQAVSGNGMFVFTFFDNQAQMRKVDSLDAITKESRKAVMVSTIKGDELDGDRVYVADLSKQQKNGRYRVWIEERGKWLDSVMPRISVAKLTVPVPKKRRYRRRIRRKPKDETAATEGAETTPTTPETPPAQAQQIPKVVMFSTTWCPSCKAAKQYFTQRGVQFLELDVEKNKAAAQKMVEIQQARGMKVGAIPLIVVGNKIFQGFSQMQIEAALAQLAQQGA